jgi:acyl-CoA thioester hydrolase
MPGLSERFPFVITQSLIWRDMDAYQHVNNAVYFRYFEDVRMALFDELGIVEHKNRTQIGPILASTRCDFRAPLSFPDRIQVGTAIEDLRPKRFVMKYAVYSETHDAMAAEGEGLLVFYDYNLNKSCEIPDVIRERLVALTASV